jgi:hypothetical protein
VPTTADASLTASDSLKLKIRLADQQLIEPLSRFRNHPRFALVFRDFLFCLHCSVRASVPLMQTAVQRCGELAADCPVAAALAPYYTKHKEEERHHDEWLLDDMVRLGMDRQDVIARVPSPDVASMIGAQYYWVHHAHPVALLAYLAVVEGNPISVDALDEIVSTTTVPKEALRTFYKHAQLDIHHSAELWEVLDSLPLMRRHVALLGVNAMFVASHMARIIDNVMKPHDSRKTMSH